MLYAVCALERLEQSGIAAFLPQRLTDSDLNPLAQK